MPSRRSGPVWGPWGLFLVALILIAGCAHAPQKKAAPMPHQPSLLDDAELSLLGQTPESEPLPVLKKTKAESLAILRLTAQPVAPADPALPALLARLKTTVLAEQGVGIAAPQVGISRRVILVQRLDQEPEKPFEACLNPEIIAMSPERELGWEGCLSVPAGFGQVERALHIRLRCQAPDGPWREVAASGYVARIFQHEIDHLNGVLFSDRMPEGVKLLPKAEYRAMREAEKIAKEKAAAEAAAAAAPQAPSPQ